MLKITLASRLRCILHGLVSTRTLYYLLPLLDYFASYLASYLCPLTSPVMIFAPGDSMLSCVPFATIRAITLVIFGIFLKRAYIQEPLTFSTTVLQSSSPFSCPFGPFYFWKCGNVILPRLLIVGIWPVLITKKNIHGRNILPVWPTSQPREWMS